MERLSLLWRGPRAAKRFERSEGSIEEPCHSHHITVYKATLWVRQEGGLVLCRVHQFYLYGIVVPVHNLTNVTGRPSSARPEKVPGRDQARR